MTSVGRQSRCRLQPIRYLRYFAEITGRIYSARNLEFDNDLHRHVADPITMISGTSAARAVRQYGRVHLQGDIRLTHKAGSATARACDIGCGGMSFYTGLQLAEGDIVRLEFEVPHSSMPFRVKAEVKNRNGLRYGVQFQELTPDEFGEIARATAILSYSQV